MKKIYYISNLLRSKKNDRNVREIPQSQIFLLLLKYNPEINIKLSCTSAGYSVKLKKKNVQVRFALVQFFTIQCNLYKISKQIFAWPNLKTYKVKPLHLNFSTKKLIYDLKKTLFLFIAGSSRVFWKKLLFIAGSSSVFNKQPLVTYFRITIFSLSHQKTLGAF